MDNQKLPDLVTLFWLKIAYCYTRQGFIAAFQRDPVIDSKVLTLRPSFLNQPGCTLYLSETWHPGAAGKHFVKEWVEDLNCMDGETA